MTKTIADVIDFAKNQVAEEINITQQERALAGLKGTYKILEFVIKKS